MLLRIDQNITMETVNKDLNVRNLRNFTKFIDYYGYYRPKYVGLYWRLASIQGWLVFKVSFYSRPASI